MTLGRVHISAMLQWNWLVGWEITVPFQHKNRLYQGQGLGWRFSYARL